MVGIDLFSTAHGSSTDIGFYNCPFHLMSWQVGGKCFWNLHRMLLGGLGRLFCQVFSRLLVCKKVIENYATPMTSLRKMQETYYTVKWCSRGKFAAFLSQESRADTVCAVSAEVGAASEQGNHKAWEFHGRSPLCSELMQDSWTC